MIYLQEDNYNFNQIYGNYTCLRKKEYFVRFAKKKRLCYNTPY